MPKVKKAFSFDNSWAQQIFRGHQDGKDYLWALTRRRYGPDDIERKGKGILIGVKEEIIYELETDKDPESTTFGERIPKKKIVFDTAGHPHEEEVRIETRYRYTHEANPINVAKFKKMCSYSTIFRTDSQLYWVFDGRVVRADIADKFWKQTLKQVKTGAIPAKVLKALSTA